ncbi:MAG TPA: hypothetical protein PLH22_00400 [Candidatus Colwellbacteria bacterium]|nr:hypothetical protein [Candidatus Colwellbacteria bacterium]
MKKNILFSLLTLAMVLIPSAHASDSATVAATVLLENVSVSVSDGTVDYGILALNSSNCTTTLSDTQIVTNEGNVGNFDADGLNVNNYWNDNRNDIIGVAASRQFTLYCCLINALFHGGRFI